MACEAFDSETLHILGNAMDQAWRRVKFNQLNGSASGARHDPCLTNFFGYGRKRPAKPSASHRRCVDAAHALSGQLRIFGIERQRRYLTNRS